MRTAILTRHAAARLGERCKLSPENLKRLLDNGVTIPVALQKGGRHAKRLLYSTPEQAWFIVVQDADDGGILTVMPLDYLKDRIAVTAAQRRCARSRVLAFEKPRLTRATCAPAASPHPDSALDYAIVPPLPEQFPMVKGLKLRVCYTSAGAVLYKNLSATLPEHGDPAAWNTPGDIHVWLREQLIAAGIPFKSVGHISARDKGQWESADGLLEHLPLTAEEIDACK